MKKLLIALSLFIGIGSFSSCSSDDEIETNDLLGIPCIPLFSEDDSLKEVELGDSLTIKILQMEDSLAYAGYRVVGYGDNKDTIYAYNVKNGFSQVYFCSYWDENYYYPIEDRYMSCWSDPVRLQLHNDGRIDYMQIEWLTIGFPDESILTFKVADEYCGHVKQLRLIFNPEPPMHRGWVTFRLAE